MRRDRWFLPSGVTLTAPLLVPMPAISAAAALGTRRSIAGPQIAIAILLRPVYRNLAWQTTNLCKGRVKSNARLDTLVSAYESLKLMKQYPNQSCSASAHHPQLQTWEHVYKCMTLMRVPVLWARGARVCAPWYILKVHTNPNLQSFPQPT